jgi:hypothetical protein
MNLEYIKNNPNKKDNNQKTINLTVNGFFVFNNIQTRLIYKVTKSIY